MDSILTSVKNFLGPAADDTAFDPELIVIINSVFGILFQLGVGPSDSPYKIIDANNTWDEFMVGDEIETVKSYIYVKVKLVFDPPSSSFVLTAYQDLAKEFEWRCNVDAETP